jgi:hypothetical protein
MELYIDGKLDAFKGHSGILQPSTKPITIGRMDNIETQYGLLGSVDEVKIWDREIPVSQVVKLKDQWLIPAGIDELELFTHVYPNPADGLINIEFTGNSRPVQVTLYASDGRKVADYLTKPFESRIKMEIPHTSSGMYLLRMVMDNGKVVTQKIIAK